MSERGLNKRLRFTLKNEIKAISSLNHILGKNFYKAVEILSKIKGKIIVSGIGKSGYIGMKMSSTLTSLGIPSVFLHPLEALHGDLGIVGREDALIAVSYSGETKEILKIVNHLKKHYIPVIAITGRRKSSLSKLSEVSLNFRIDSEGSPFNLAPMASVTATLVIGDLLAVALSSKRGFTQKEFADLHPGGSLGLQLSKVEELMTKGKNTPIVKIGFSLKEVLEEITKKRLGITAVVNKQGKLTGVITDGDIRRFLLTGKSSDNLRAKDLMTERPKTIDKSDSLQAALSKMELYKITSLFVVDRNKKPVGTIHMHSIIENKLI